MTASKFFWSGQVFDLLTFGLVASVLGGSGEANPIIRELYSTAGFLAVAALKMGAAGFVYLVAMKYGWPGVLWVGGIIGYVGTTTNIVVML